MNQLVFKDRFFLLGRSWAESLKIFLPSSLRLFLLITANAYIKGWKLFFTHWWFLIIALPLISSFFVKFNAIIQLFLLAPLIFLWCLSVRPSVLKKTYSYFLSYGHHIMMSICFTVLLFIVPKLWYLLLKKTLAFPIVRFFLTTMHVMVFGLTLMPILYFSPFFIITLFFIFDSDGGVKSALQSFIRALKMIIYNYPFFLSIFLLFFYGYFVLHALIPWQFLSKFYFFDISIWVSYGIFLFLTTLFSTIMNVFYTKRVYEYLSLYVD